MSKDVNMEIIMIANKSKIIAKREAKKNSKSEIKTILSKTGKFFNKIKERSILKCKIYKSKYLIFILLIILFIFIINRTQKSANRTSNDKMLNYRNKLLQVISNITRKEVKTVNTIILIGSLRFGNSLVALSNTIFSCEILFCKEIIIPKDFWFIKSPIYYKKFNINIYLNNGKRKCNKFGVICIQIKIFYFFRFGVMDPEERFYVFKDEILKNLENYDLNVNDLYIHIRSGDIFQFSTTDKIYAQPPLCFYDSIINNFSFRKIFILSEDKNNPIIDVLLKKYSNVYYLHNNLRQDMSYIINAYNLVISCSSFVLGLVRLSKKLRVLIRYDFIHKINKHFWLISNKIFDSTFVDIVMEASKEYKSQIIKCRNVDEDKKFLLTFICRSVKFIIRPPNLKNINFSD